MTKWCKLFTDIGPHYKTRPGGYLRILNHGLRPGDNAPMAIMQLVDRKTATEVAKAPTEKPVEKKAKPEKKPKVEKLSKAQKQNQNQGQD